MNRAPRLVSIEQSPEPVIVWNMRYIAGEINHCPGCGRAQWLIGRTIAECAFCHSAVPLADQPSRQHRPMLRLGKGGGKVSRALAAA